jgi:hypothetical protein
VVTGRWTGHGLCLTRRVRSAFSVFACFGLLIGRGGASGHSRPDASGRSGSLLDSNRTLALWRPVSSPARPVRYGTSASGPCDQRVRSVLRESSRCAIGASGQFDQRIRSTRFRLFQVRNDYIRRGTSINTRWPAQGSLSLGHLIYL